MKTDGRLARCGLKGTLGDAIFAVLCGCGHNLRKILAHLRAWLAQILAGSGFDLLKGGTGDDTLNGGAGDDTVLVIGRQVDVAELQ